MFTLLTNLDRRYIEPLVITPAEGVLARRFREAGIPVYILSTPSILDVFGKQILRYSIVKKIHVAWELIKYNMKVCRFLRGIHADLIYVNDLRALIYAGLAARLARLPVVWYLRADERIKFVTAFGVRVANVVITICNMKEAFTPYELKKYSHKFKVLHTGFDFNPFTNLDFARAREDVRRELQISLDAKVVGLVGSITPRKGHDLLIEAAPKIISRIPNVHFLFVGDAVEGYVDFIRSLKEKLNALNLTSRFHWAGFREDIERLYAAMDVLVLPSRSEGLPRTVIEALAAGLPVVCSDVGGVREIVTSRDIGYIIEKDDPVQLANTVVEVLTNHNLHTSSARVTRQNFVFQRFSIQSYISGFMCVIDDLLKVRWEKRDE